MCDSCSVTAMPGQPAGALAERAGVHPLGQPVGDHPGQHLGGGVDAGELRLVVQVAVVELAEDGVELLGGQADVHDDAVGVELGPPEGRVDDVRRAVQPLGGSEDLAAETVGDHHVVADRHAEQVHSPWRSVRRWYPTSATLDNPVHWRITKAGAEGALVREIRASSLFEKLEPGTYDVEARLGLARVRQTVDVAADTATQVRVDLNGGVLKMQARAADATAPLTSAIFTVAPANAEKGSAPLWVGRDAHPEIVIPAGEYSVTAQNGLARQQSNVTIAPAAGTSFNSRLASGQLELSATRGTAAGQGDPVTGNVTFILAQDDPDAPQGRREVARSAAPAPTFALPAGTYYATARTPSAEVREQIAIGAGDVVKRVMPLSLAHIKLAATIGGQPPGVNTIVTYRVVRLDGEPREIARTIAAEPEYDLSAGRYRFEASLGGSNVIAATDLALAAGQAQKVTLPLEGGSVTLKRDAAAPGDVYWEVRDEKQRTVLRSSQPQPTAVLAPGRYVVSAETSEQPLRNAIEVKANEHRTFDFSGQ